MEKICDLHIHSRYSKGTSNLINIRKLAQNSRLKGIDIVGTGDCFHSLWLKEINLYLEEDSVGLFSFPRIPHLISIIYGGSEYDNKNLSLYRDIVKATNGEYNIWENNTDFYPIPNELHEAINKIKSGNYWFIPGYDGVYEKLQIGQNLNHI